MGQFEELVSKLNNDGQEAVLKDDENKYVRLSQIVDAISDSLREYAQEITAEHLQKLSDKLKSESSLSSEDLQLLRMWIVGDAENYINTENSVPEWKKELQRVMREILHFTNDSMPVEDIFKLQALLRDADRVIDDLAFYAAQKDRVAKFDVAVQNLSGEDREFLTALLTTKLKSKYY